MKKQNNIIIGIAGPARAGKDTVADMLRNTGINFPIIPLSYPIKKMLEIGLGLTTEQIHGRLKEQVDPRYGHSPRKLMQLLGTEWGRELVDPNIWIKMIATKYYNKVIIPDIRFENEAKYVRKHGILLHIIRADISIKSDHISEKGVRNLSEDFIIVNNGDLIALQSQVKRIAKYIINSWEIK